MYFVHRQYDNCIIKIEEFDGLVRFVALYDRHGIKCNISSALTTLLLNDFKKEFRKMRPDELNEFKAGEL